MARTTGLNTPTVLVVDDETDLRTVVAELLEEEGYAVKQASDGLAALQEVEADGIDVILTDVRMPRLDGASLVRHLRHQGITMPVVVMSATPAKLDVPGVRYLPKPFAAEHLLSTITIALTARA
jgi:two-component system response regulator MprA